MMKVRKIVSLVMVFTMLSQVPVLAEEVPIVEEIQSEEKSWEETQLEQLDKMKPEKLDKEQLEQFSAEDGIQPYTTTPDDFEPNDTPDTAYPYSKVETLTTQLTGRDQLYDLGMKHAGLHSETDEDWFTVSITAGQTYFVDLRNVGKRNWYIELYNYDKGYYYTTNPSVYSKFLDVGEKSFYFDAEDTGTFYIKICSNGEWVGDEMHYFFYVGPAIQTYRLVNFPTYGQTGGLISPNNTYSFNMVGEVPSQTAIVNMSITDVFSRGNACTEIDKYMSAGGKTYRNTRSGENTISGIRDVPLGQYWIFGASCARDMHGSTHWSAMLNGSFQCVMEPYNK